MEQLFSKLHTITELLEQIYSITQNQTTVLLESEKNTDTLDMLERMFEYKKEMMNELEGVEVTFQAAYQNIRPHLEGKRELIELQKQVAIILKLKDEIVAIEGKNLLLMQERSHRQIEKIEVPKDPVKAVEAYKKHKKQSPNR